MEVYQGPCLALAGPGSGKTYTLTLRIQNLIQQHKVMPEHILVITFTKAAAIEMKERFENLMGASYAPVVFGTFHSVFYHILQNSYHFGKKDILLEHHKLELLRHALAVCHIELEDEPQIYEEFLREISFLKNTMTSPREYVSKLLSSEDFLWVYQTYEQLKRDEHKLDFDDMMTLTYELLTKNAEVLHAWQKQFTYLLIDEIQDMNQLQFKIIQLLARPENNLFVVGDDDQSIYGFRGADPNLMLSFPQQYPQCRQILLDRNYRCGRKIVEASLALIQHNTRRFAKCIKTEQAEPGHITYQSFDDNGAEHEAVLGIIADKQKDKLPLEKVAILYRRNTQVLGLVEKLVERGIPFHVKERLDNIYNHWITKDLMSYLRIAIGIAGRSDFLRICNRPLRYISRASIDYEEMTFEEWKKYYRDQAHMLERITLLEHQIYLMKQMSSYAAVNYIRKGIGYDEYLKDYAAKHQIREECLFEIADMIRDSAKAYMDKKKYIDHIQKMEQTMDKMNKQTGTECHQGVGLYTLHGAKGLEFHTVIIIDVNEGIMPSKRAKSTEEIEEERRMFYVGITRAQVELFLYAIAKCNNEMLVPSRFIREMGIAMS